MKSIHRFSQSGCRICGKLNGTFVNVLEKKSKRYLLQIRKFLKVEISGSDDFSKNICHTCIATLNDFALLFEQCQVIQQQLDESMTNEEILENENANADEANDSGHLNSNDLGNDDNHKPVLPNLIILNEQPHLLNVVEGIEEGSSDPLSSESNIAIDQEVDDETQINFRRDRYKELNNSKIFPEESDQFEASNSDGDWKIQKLPNSDMKLYLCNKCSSILLCERAKKSHKCHKIEDNQEISETLQKKPKLESNS